MQHIVHKRCKYKPGFNQFSLLIGQMLGVVCFLQGKKDWVDSLKTNGICPTVCVALWPCSITRGTQHQVTAFAMETALHLILLNPGISLSWLISNAGGNFFFFWPKSSLPNQEMIKRLKSSCLNTLRKLSWFYTFIHAQSGGWSKSHGHRIQLEPSRLLAFSSTSEPSCLTFISWGICSSICTSSRSPCN